jgi:hypothetical protein
MEYIRFFDVCRVVLSGHIQQTDGKGNAYFDNFKIERGPQALYTLQYIIQVNNYTELLSETFNVYARSSINILESRNAGSLLFYADMNKPLENQPEVRLIDFYGEPVVGRKVVAFSWIQPTISTLGGHKNSASNNKMFILKDFISEPSDKEGIAKFKSLTVIATAESIAFLHFYAEGKTTVWTDRYSVQIFDPILPPRAIYPLIINSYKPKISVMNDQNRKVVEGNKISPPIILETSDMQTGAPMSGVS